MSAIFLWSTASFAQKDWFELLPGSERLSYDSKSGLERLTGVICFTYQGNIMYCDSAHLKRSTKEIWAYGKVHLNKRDTLNLFCDSMYYNGNTKMAKLWGNVRVRDREYKLTTDTLEYDAKRSQAIYRYGGKIENITSTEMLTSQIGYFHPNTEESFFKGKVVYKGPDLKMTTDTLQYNYLKHRVYFYGPTDIRQKKTTLHCSKGWYDVQTEEGVLQGNASIHQAPRIISGDSLYYAPRTKMAIGKGSVSIVDTAQKVVLAGGFLYSDDGLHKDVLADSPLITYYKTKDTLYLRADTLIHYRDSLNKTKQILGNSDVRLFQNNMQALADTFAYNQFIGRMDLWGNPYFWSKNSELHADSITVFLMQDTIIDRVFLRSNAFAANELDSGRFYNQLAGRELWAYFKNNELVKSIVKGNAKTIFFPEQEQHKDSITILKRSGMNRVFASDINVYLDSGEVTGVTFLTMPDGVFYPMNELDSTEQFLQGFSWHPALRPKSWKELLVSRTPPREIPKISQKAVTVPTHKKKKKRNN
jgi:lipopolysaccharide export system protein LptA